MYRRAQLLVIGFALTMGVLAVIAGVATDSPLKDPEGSFLGPSWLRLPLLLVGAVGADLVPRTLWLSRLRTREMPAIFRERVRTHWSKERLALVATGVLGFYIVYVSYRNLKSMMPKVYPGGYDFDRELHLIDRAIFFGHEPAHVLHALLGTSFSAWFLSLIYLWFLPLVPLCVTAWVVWSRNLRYGYWFVGAQCIAWSLGTLAYYCLPTLGPGLAYPQVYTDLPVTPTEDLIDALVNARHSVLLGPEGGVQSVAAFASLHTAITLLVALMVQNTVKTRWPRFNRYLRIFFWVNFVITVIATLYFGWHYVADDIAGITIALLSFYLAGIATGHTFKRKGLRNEAAEALEIKAEETRVREGRHAVEHHGARREGSEHQGAEPV